MGYMFPYSFLILIIYFISKALFYLTKYIKKIFKFEINEISLFVEKINFLPFIFIILI
jgi:hypothetical protein